MTTARFLGKQSRPVRGWAVPIVWVLSAPAMLVWLVANLLSFVLMLPAIAVGFLCQEPKRGAWRR
jgi:hypothetical protein